MAQCRRNTDGVGLDPLRQGISHPSPFSPMQSGQGFSGGMDVPVLDEGTCEELDPFSHFGQGKGWQVQSSAGGWPEGCSQQRSPPTCPWEEPSQALSFTGLGTVSLLPCCFFFLFGQAAGTWRRRRGFQCERGGGVWATPPPRRDTGLRLDHTSSSHQEGSPASAPSQAIPSPPPSSSPPPRL